MYSSEKIYIEYDDGFIPSEFEYDCIIKNSDYNMLSDAIKTSNINKLQSTNLYKFLDVMGCKVEGNVLILAFKSFNSFNFEDNCGNRGLLKAISNDYNTNVNLNFFMSTRDFSDFKNKKNNKYDFRSICKEIGSFYTDIDINENIDKNTINIPVDNKPNVGEYFCIDVDKDEILLKQSFGLDNNKSGFRIFIDDNKIYEEVYPGISFLFSDHGFYKDGLYTDYYFIDESSMKTFIKKEIYNILKKEFEFIKIDDFDIDILEFYNFFIRIKFKFNVTSDESIEISKFFNDYNDIFSDEDYKTFDNDDSDELKEKILNFIDEKRYKLKDLINYTMYLKFTTDRTIENIVNEFNTLKNDIISEFKLDKDPEFIKKVEELSIDKIIQINKIKKKIEDKNVEKGKGNKKKDPNIIKFTNKLKKDKPNKSNNNKLGCCGMSCKKN